MCIYIMCIFSPKVKRPSLPRYKTIVSRPESYWLFNVVL